MLKKEFGVGVSPETQALWQSLTSPDNAAATSLNSQSASVAAAGQHPRRPSISVAGFVNLTGGRGDDYFARGLVQDIVTALSEVSDYVVLSSFQDVQKDNDGNKPAVPGGTQPRYVLGGSVQRSRDELRVNIQLADTADGHTVWAQKFDGRFENLLEFQDRIAQAVVLAVTLELQLSNWKVRDKSRRADRKCAPAGERRPHEIFRDDAGLASAGERSLRAGARNRS